MIHECYTTLQETNTKLFLLIIKFRF